jgi:hypothetical protein
MDLFSLQRLIGHTDIAILRQYLALAESDAEAAHKKVGPVDNMLPRRGRQWHLGIVKKGSICYNADVP